MFQTGSLSRSRKRVFNSVFAPVTLTEDTPTPLATPAFASTAPGQAFGSVTVPEAADGKTTSTEFEEPEPEAIIRSRAWHSATEFLVLPNRTYDTLSSYIEHAKSLSLQPKQVTAETETALTYLLSPSSHGRTFHQDLKEYDLVRWYCNELRRHFVTSLRAILGAALENDTEDEPGCLSEVVRCLQLAQHIYFTPFLNHLAPKLDIADRDISFSKLRESFQAIVAHSLSSRRISNLLETALTNDAFVILGISQARDDQADGDEYHQESDMEIDNPVSTAYPAWKNIPSEDIRTQIMAEQDDDQLAEARHRLLSLLQGMQDVGLGGHRAQKVFAQIMNDMMTEFIVVSYKEQWDSPSLVVQHLRLWVENVFARLAVEVLAILQPSSSDNPDGQLDNVRLDDVEKWQEIGIARLGALRTSELFDVIVDWDSSSGAIEDLKQYTTHTASRISLATAFISMLSQRLLHPGASTVQILQLYISIIRAFNLLDPKGVLLDRAARPIRKYLRDRDDTIKAIVGGLLADNPNNEAGANTDSGETLVELSTELNNAHQRNIQNESGELDWDDMAWMPDPVDAAADYKKSRGADVVGSLISLFESKEAFVKELQNMLSERLLKKKADFDQELSVLELLKVRFGDGALQSCEVMLRDVLDSKRVDAVIRNDQALATKQTVTPGRAPQSLEQPRLHAKILSRFFWPTIQDQPFNVPEEIDELQQRYCAGFESLKQSRKLKWLNALGHVTVELDLEDRVFTDEVTTWQATVIYAFQSETTDSSAPVTKTVTQLAETLNMSTSLVRSACLFWVSKRILSEVQRDSFRVLEVLPSDEDHEMTASGEQEAIDASATEANAAAAADAAAAAAAKETANAAAMEKMNLYWQFIVGMLTNQGAMPLQRIIMMLKIVVPGGFPFGNEELREFLAGMVAQGKLEIVSGGNYKIVR